MANIDIVATLEKVPEQGIQAQLDTIYLYNPDEANRLIEQLNEDIEEIERVYNSLGALAFKDQITNADIADDANISRSKLASDVTDSLDLADTAVQTIASSGTTIEVSREGNAVVITDKTFIFEMSEAAQVWEVEHNLDRFPTVVVVDSAGTTVDFSCTYVDSNNCELRFNAAFKGKAYLN